MKAKKFRKETRVFIYTKNELKDIDGFAEDFADQQNKELVEFVKKAAFFHPDGNPLSLIKEAQKLLNK